MAVLTPFLLVFDASAVLGSGEREWREFSRIGECLVPRAVLDEIQLLCDRATESSQEQTAREFSRFFPGSGWKPTLSVATHPSLKPAEGHALSKKARLSFTVAQNAYGLSRNRPDALVILVANDQGLTQRIRELEIKNLCVVPVAALVQWSRTERKPPVVIHQLQAMRAAPQAAPVVAGKPSQTKSIPPPVPVEQQWSTGRRPRRRFRISITNIFYNLLTLGMVGAAALTLWYFVFPHSFAQFWQQLPFVEQSSPRQRR